MNTYKNFINGDWVEASSGRTFRTFNPADCREELTKYPASEEEDIQRAIKAAQSAFPEWRKTPAVKRAKYLARIAEFLDSQKKGLAEVLTLEHGKTVLESRAEIERTIDVFRFYSGLGYTLGGQAIPHDEPQNLTYTTREPLGVVGIITPWSLPLVIPAWKVAPALLTGNAVVLKPASQAPAMAFEIAKALGEAQLPGGVLNVVAGSGECVGARLVDNSAVNAISFTGSRSVGQKIAKHTAARMARSQIEMGGKNPTIVLEDADLDLAATLVAQSAYGMAGQSHLATSRVLVDRRVADEFGMKLAKQAAAIKLGFGLIHNVTMGPLISRHQLDASLANIALAVGEGAILLHGGQRLREGDLEHGNFLMPTVLSSVSPKMRISKEEVFGPVVAIMPVDGVEEAISLANRLNVGITATVVSRNVSRALKCAEALDAGVVKVNQRSDSFVVQAPLGGVKRSSSGAGRELGQEAIDFYTRSRIVYVDYSV